MADNNIMKDFVKKQSTPISIGIPKQRPQVQETVKEEPRKNDAPVYAKEPAQATATTLAATAEPKKVGRPKSDVEKVKLSLYLPKEMKERVVRLQHISMKSCLNDVLMEAIEDLLAKNNI